MAPFPYMPMTAIMVGLVSQQVVQMSIFAYAGFMVEFLGAVDDTDKAGEDLICRFNNVLGHEELKVFFIILTG